ncbi:MAG: hypothetical protein RJB59_893 [Actinomycetota bacterium]
MRSSPIAPPLVELARTLNMPTIPLSVREFRKLAPKIETKGNIENSGHTSPGEVLLSITQLSAAYQDSQRAYALSKVNLEIRAGEIVALMGRNGAGKTTLLKCAVGLAPVFEGQVRVCGRDPVQLEGPELIKNVGYVPQEPTDLLYGQSILEECSLADRDNNVPDGSTLNIYRSLMQIPDLSSHPRDVSEGQRLGLALSIILSAQPPLIVLDEPTRGLDYQAKKTLVQILKQVATQHRRAVLISTHDVELVAEVADRVLFLADGELIADGSTAQVLNASPAFAPQVAKALPHTNWITVDEAERYFNAKK